MVDHLAVQLPDHRALEVEFAYEERTGGDVDNRARKGFIEGCIAGAEADEAGAGTQSVTEGGAEGEEGVFGCVMVVDCFGGSGYLLDEFGEYGKIEHTC